MGIRIVFELNENPKTRPKIWNKIKKTIEDAGGTYLTEPPKNPPYIITAVMPNEESAQKMSEKLRSTKGIKQADVDQMRFTLEPPWNNSNPDSNANLKTHIDPATTEFSAYSFSCLDYNSHTKYFSKSNSGNLHSDPNFNTDSHRQPNTYACIFRQPIRISECIELLEPK